MSLPLNFLLGSIGLNYEFDIRHLQHVAIPLITSQPNLTLHWQPDNQPGRIRRHRRPVAFRIGNHFAVSPLELERDRLVNCFTGNRNPGLSTTE